jgi:Cof subfamily protein (haloacid dehalogenase superfamily)
MHNSPRALFIDIDETLTTHREGPFEEDIREIERAREAGHKVYLNTGRALGNIPAELQQVPWIDGIVAGGGAHVVLEGKTFYHKWVPKAALLAISEYYLKSDKWCVFEGETDLYQIHWERNYESPFKAITKADDFSTMYTGALITKMTIAGDISEDEQRLLGDTFQLIPQRRYFEGIIRGESKARGMELILQEIGIDRENSIAIGDSANDIEMLRYAGLSIAMGNARDEVKAIADVITTDCGKGGVGAAIRRYIL